MAQAAMAEQIVEQQVLQTDQVDKYLTFHLGQEDFGIPIHHVTEIIGIQAITQVPDMPYHLRGVINLRGKVIPVMDVRLRFQMAERAYDERTCIIVVEVSARQVGLIVDMVNEVLDIPEGQIQPAPKSGQMDNGFIQGIGKVGDRVKILLDLNRFLGQVDPINLEAEESASSTIN